MSQHFTRENVARTLLEHRATIREYRIKLTIIWITIFAIGFSIVYFKPFFINLFNF